MSAIVSCGIEPSKDHIKCLLLKLGFSVLQLVFCKLSSCQLLQENLEIKVCLETSDLTMVGVLYPKYNTSY